MSAVINVTRLSSLVLLAFLLSDPLSALEQPEFELVAEVGKVEIRKYPAHIVAKTLVAGSFEEVGNQGFKRLAGYIFGGNGEDRKIAMTAPVALEPDAEASPDEQYWVTFSMPREYSRDQLPKPNDSRVQILEVPEKYLAVLRYRGSWSQERYLTHESLLLSLISTDEAWVRLGEPSWSRYDPPFVPWFMRTNEVAIEVVPADQVKR